jgi:hypothetical protein
MRSDSSWIPPITHMLKYNNPGPSRIGGVLRDHGDKFLYIFFCSIVNMDSNETEVLAIQKVILLNIDCNYVFSNQWFDSYVQCWIKGKNIMRT